MTGDTDIQSRLDFLKMAIAKLSHVPRVLIVEDDPNDAYLLSKTLEQFECESVEADGIEKAKEKLRAEKYDLVFVDFTLPPLPIEDALSELKKAANEGNYIVLSGNQSPIVRSRALNAGAKLFLEKPVTKEVLSTVLKPKL